MSARLLPANWSSTGNSLEAVAFYAKDTVLVVDDFCPAGAQTDVARTHKEAERLFRAQGNRSGRGRMRPDGTLKLAKPPRGVILGTGEDLPKGHSLRARLAVIQVGPTDVAFARLTEHQAAAANGSFAQAMAGYIKYLAGRYESFVERMKADIARVRDEISAEGCHRRTPTNIAELVVGFGLFLEFATEVGAITLEQASGLFSRCRSALLETASEQAQHQSDADPCIRYFALLGSALTSGRAFVTNQDGGRPETSPGAWGWRHAAAAPIITKEEKERGTQ